MAAEAGPEAEGAVPGETREMAATGTEALEEIGQVVQHNLKVGASLFFSHGLLVVVMDGLGYFLLKIMSLLLYVYTG